jgi:DNA-binding NarL/FixJ family response regulator
MSLVSVPAATNGAHRALVVGDDAEARRDAVACLRAAGFELARDGARPRPWTLLAVLERQTELERLRELRELSEAHPECPILAVVPAGLGNPSLRRVMLAGATGIVLGTELARTLGPTAVAVLAGQLAVPASLSAQIAPRPLSHREKQILGLVTRGLTNREIARELYLAESTVKTHLSAAFRKIDARSRAEAVARIQDPESGYGPSILALARAGSA